MYLELGFEDCGPGVGHFGHLNGWGPAPPRPALRSASPRCRSVGAMLSASKNPTPNLNMQTAYCLLLGANGPLRLSAVRPRTRADTAGTRTFCQEPFCGAEQETTFSAETVHRVRANSNRKDNWSGMRGF